MTTKPTRLKIAGLAILILIAVGCTPVRVSTSTVIDRPVPATWAVFADPGRLGEWIHESWGGETMDWADIDDARVLVPRLVRFAEGDDELVMTQTVTALEPFRAFCYSLDNDWADTDHSFRFEPDGINGCTVYWDLAVRANGGKGILVAFARGSMEDRLDHHLAQLKSIVEAEPHTPPGPGTTRANARTE